MNLLKCKTFLIVVAFGLLLFLGPELGNVSAASPIFTLYPSTGYALIGEDFAVDIMLDTDGVQTSKARAVFRFDPTEVRVTKAEYAELYCQYPEDEYTVDNSLGWVMLTGYCLDPYYTTSGEAELFGRISFKPLVEGETTFMFVEDYEDSDWETMIMDTGSPPQTVSGLSVTGGTYTTVTSIDGTQPIDGDLPGVGIFDDMRIVGGVILLVAAAGVLMVDWRIRKAKRKSGDRTVIL